MISILGLLLGGYGLWWFWRWLDVALGNAQYGT